MSVPIIETPRLILRPLRTSDEPEFLALAGDWQVARMTSDIPHPLLPAQARAWLKPIQGDVRFAIDLQGHLIGSAGYFRRRSGVGELGFWLGRQHWGLGFATEAAGAVLRHGFAVDGHTAFSSAHFADNAASRRVLGKLGFEEAGQSRMWCSARGFEVDAVTMWLSRERADIVLGSMGEAPAPAQEAGSNRFSRWLDQARRAIRDHTRT